jgi:hypothetical protein
MAKPLKMEHKTKLKLTGAVKDLIVIFTITILVVVISYFFDILKILVDYFQNNPKSITYIDEIIVGFLTLIIGFAIFSWRRWTELKKETFQRLKLQEELINIAQTKAETERIICRQLHCELDEYKKVELDVLSRQAKLKNKDHLDKS